MPNSYFCPKFKRFLFCSITLILFSFPQYLYSQTKPTDGQFYLMEALRQYNTGSIEEAKKSFEAILSKDSNSDVSYYYLSNISFKKGDLSNAEKYILAACKIDPSNYWYQVMLSKIFVLSKKYDKATEVFEGLRKNYPQKTELYDDMIDVYIQQKKIDKAISIVNDIERVGGKNEATALTRFNLMIYQGEKEEAMNQLKEYDKVFSSPRIATIIGDYYANNQSDTLAFDYYTKALSLDPNYIPASFGLAETYRVKRQYDLYFERINPFLANKDVDPSMKVSYIKEILANRQFIQTFLPQIDTMMANLYSAHPKDSSIAYSYMTFLVQSQKNDQAIEVLKKNIINYPQSKEVYKQYFSLLYYLSEWDALTNESKAALNKFKGDPAIMELHGIGLLQLKKVSESIEIFKQILSLSKDSSTTVRALSALGDLYHEVGDKKNSYKYYDKTLKFEPNHIASLNNYSYFLCLEKKQLNKAYKMSKKTVDAEPNNPTYLDTFAWILYNMGKYVEAKAILKHALLYGGKENADILDHYAEVLFMLKEYDLAFIYWEQVKALDPSKDIDKKVEERKKERK